MMGGAFEDIRNFSKKSLKVPKKLNGVPFSQKCLPVSRFSFSTLLKYPETALSKGSRTQTSPQEPDGRNWLTSLWAPVGLKWGAQDLRPGGHRGIGGGILPRG